ncbi:hypothetical protein COO60DRAFT_1540857 [Scenedesmus sp. NREL 46B-D3]|nr:hypothetical protein COO60DRAFT_1540857 [Scenedesmus sp. NREL 46B-D3]
MAGAGSNSSPAGSGSMVMYTTPCTTPAPFGSSTPAGTPRPLSAGLGSLMPPASNMMYRHHQQPPPPAMLPPPYGSRQSIAARGRFSAGAGSSSSSTPRGGVSVAGMGGISISISSSVMTSPVSAGMQLGSSAGSNMGLAAAAASLPPTIPESYSGDAILDQQGPGSLAGSSSSGMGGGSEYGVAAAAGQADVESGSPLARRRSGYRSSLRKGLMVYDQHKYRQRYQEQVSQPLDPRTEISRRYRNRVPAI